MKTRCTLFSSGYMEVVRKYTTEISFSNPLIGWCLGNIELDDYYLRRLSADLKISILNVEYR